MWNYPTPTCTVLLWKVIIYFDKNTLNLIGWKTIDIYQNQVETKLSNVETNVNLNFKLFDIQNYIN